MDGDTEGVGGRGMVVVVALVEGSEGGGREGLKALDMVDELGEVDDRVQQPIQ